MTNEQQKLERLEREQWNRLHFPRETPKEEWHIPFSEDDRPHRISKDALINGVCMAVIIAMSIGLIMWANSTIVG